MAQGMSGDQKMAHPRMARGCMGGRSAVSAAQGMAADAAVAMKRRFDPMGLLNPGKLRIPPRTQYTVRGFVIAKDEVQCHVVLHPCAGF